MFTICWKWTEVLIVVVASYCASKGAVANLTRNIAIDYSEHLIHCNAICPGRKFPPLLLTMPSPPSSKVSKLTTTQTSKQQSSLKRQRTWWRHLKWRKCILSKVPGIRLILLEWLLCWRVKMRVGWLVLVWLWMVGILRDDVCSKFGHWSWWIGGYEASYVM